MAHLKGLTQALEQVVIVDKVDQVMERHEASMKLAMSEMSNEFKLAMSEMSNEFKLAMSEMYGDLNTKIEVGFANQNTKIEAQTKVFVGILALFLTIVTAVLKFS